MLVAHGVSFETFTKGDEMAEVVPRAHRQKRGVGALSTGAPGAITTSATFPEQGVYPCADSVTCNEPLTQKDGLGNTTSYTFNPTTGQL
jgi:hypothetical protein